MKENKAERKIEVRVISAENSLKVGGASLPIQKIVRSKNQIIREIQKQKGRKKTIIEEKKNTKEEKVENEILEEAHKILQERFGNIQSMGFRQMQLDSGRTLPFNLFIEAVNEAMIAHPRNIVQKTHWWQPYRNSKDELCVALAYEPYPEPLQPKHKKEFRESFYQHMIRSMPKNLPHVECVYEPQQDRYFEIVEQEEPLFETIKEMMYSWGDFSQSEQRVIKENIGSFLIKLLDFFESTGYFPRVDETMSSISEGSFVILTKNHEPQMTEWRRPLSVPWQIMQHLRASEGSILSKDPLRFSDAIKAKIYKDECLKADISASHLRKVSCLDPLFEDIEQLLLWTKI